MRQPATGGVAVVVFRRGEPTMVFMPGDGRSLGELLVAAGTVDLATLDGLVQGRVQGGLSLERLLQERTNLEPEQVGRFFDFQARARLLDVLTWREGFFELQEYRGGGETAFSLVLPGVESLVQRADARSRVMPDLLHRLPAAPANVVVRRRRGGSVPSDQLAGKVLAELAEPLLITQLVARLLVDDDLVIDTVLRLVEGKAVTIRPRVALAPSPRAGAALDPRLGVVLREVLAGIREGTVQTAPATLTVVVLAATSADSVRFVTRLSGESAPLSDGGDGSLPTGLARRVIDCGDDAHLALLAIRPEALTRGALEGVLSRFDALILLRTGEDPGEADRLQHLRAVARVGASRKPVTLAIELGSAFRPWDDYPDAMLGIADWETQPPSWLAERVVEGLLAAMRARG